MLCTVSFVLTGNILSYTINKKKLKNLLNICDNSIRSCAVQAIQININEFIITFN